MAINLGASAVNDVYLGSTQAAAVYLGSTLVWEPSGGGPTPVAEYEFNEGTGTTASDTLGFLGNFTFNGNTATWGTGTVKGRMQQAVDINPLGATNNWSVVSRMRTLTTGFRYCIQGPTNTGTWYCWFDNSKIALYHPTPGDVKEAVASMVVNTYATCAWVNDADNDEIRLYVNGVLKHTGSAAVNAPMRKGGNVVCEGEQVEVDWLNIYDVALTDAQVASL